MPAKSLPQERRFTPGKVEKINLFESERMFFDLHCLAPGIAQKPHVHEDSDKIYCVMEGRATFSIGEEEFTAGALSTVFAPAGIPHGVRNDGPDGLSLLVFMAPHPNYVRHSTSS